MYNIEIIEGFNFYNTKTGEYSHIHNLVDMFSHICNEYCECDNEDDRYSIYDWKSGQSKCKYCYWLNNLETVDEQIMFNCIEEQGYVVEDKYDIPFEQARLLDCYNYRQTVDVLTLLYKLQSKECHNYRKLPITLDFGNISIELHVYKDIEGICMEYHVNIISEECGWHLFDEIIASVDLGSNVEKQLYNILMNTAKEHKLTWTRPNYGLTSW